ncbi:MAG: 50S ribosomal protein L11 methyltransferase [Blastocatellia bacterium]
MTAKPNSWFAIEISVEPKVTEAIEFAFNALDSLGNEISQMPNDRIDFAVVIGYFKALPDDQIVHDELHYALRAYGYSEDAVKSITRREVLNTDWLAEWKKHWKPTVVGRFSIAPPWEDVDGNSKIVIKIEPNMAFGTGTHETTKLCLKAIDKEFEPGESFLDVGTGTGILSIAATKLAAEYPERSGGGRHSHQNAHFSVGSKIKNSVVSVAKIFACDTDKDSIAIAKENAALNSVAENIEFSTGSISSETPRSDFVCANLTIDVILPMLALLLEKTKRLLVLSGILREQEEMIVKALSDNVFEVNRLGEWIAVVIRKTD